MHQSMVSPRMGGNGHTHEVWYKISTTLCCCRVGKVVNIGNIVKNNCRKKHQRNRECWWFWQFWKRIMWVKIFISWILERFPFVDRNQKFPWEIRICTAHSTAKLPKRMETLRRIPLFPFQPKRSEIIALFANSIVTNPVHHGQILRTSTFSRVVWQL